MEGKFRKIEINSQSYPLILKEISSPPNLIYLKGKINPKENRIAIVGTRKADQEGREIAYNLSYRLAKQNLVIVSGLAFGIDSAAHKGALAADGKTIAVLGCGIDKIYPASNKNLAEEIINKNGAIISEYPPGYPSYRSNFPARNRIISGLSIAIIVVQAPLKSGALITASFALDQGREVFVVPGSIRNPNYQGSHQLIKEGAKIITSAEDALEYLNIKPENTLFPTEKEKIILEAIKKSNKNPTIDEIVKIVKLESRDVASILTSLTIKGLIKETIKGYKLNKKL